MSALERKTRWRALLALALPTLDHVFPPDRAQRKAQWTLGGGTAIAARIDHRVSHDIDIFVGGTQLKAFTPAANPLARAISQDFEWPGHYLKFKRPEGEIDFLSSPLQTSPGYTWKRFKDRRIAIETMEEIIVKKIRYRSAKFTARDVFDLAAVASNVENLAAVLAAEVPDALARTIQAVAFHKDKGLERLAEAIVLTNVGKKILPTTFETALQVLQSAEKLAAPNHDGI